VRPGHLSPLLTCCLFLLCFPSTAPAQEIQSPLLTTEEKAWIAEHPVIRTRISDYYAPFEFLDGGEYKGYAYDILSLISERFGLTFQPAPPMPWEEALRRIRDRKGIDLILLLTHTREREAFINFTTDYVSFPKVIFSRKDGPAISRLDNLSGLKVAVEKGFSEADMLRRDVAGIVILDARNTADALRAVSTGRADAYVGNLAVGSYLIDRLGLTNLQVTAPTPYESDRLAMGIRKDWPILAGIIQKGLDHISPEQLQEIHNRWFAIRYKPGLDLFDIVKWLLPAAAVGLAFIIQLNRMVLRRTRELQASQRLLRAIQDNAFQSLWLLTPEGILKDANRTALKAIDAVIEDVAGKPFWRTPWWNHNRKTREQIRKAVENGREGRKVRFEIATGTVNDDNFRIIDFNLIPIHDPEGKVIHLVPSGHDITKIKELEEKAIRSSQLAAIGELAAGVAHEINNPINGILNYVQILLDKSRDPFFRDILDRVMKEADRVESIVRNLLSFARDTPARHHPLNPAKIIEETLALCQMQLVTSGIHLRVETAPDLPCIRGNRQQIVQVLLNLISNARHTLNERYPETDPDKVLYITTARCRHQGRDMVCLSVEDRGGGIPRQHLAHVVKPFFTTKPEGKGTGLGLSISHDIIKQHDGTLEITSTPGEGTRIDIRLPIAEEQVTLQSNGNAVGPDTATSNP